MLLRIIKIIKLIFRKTPNYPVYKDFELEDFITDEFFVKWVRNPDDETSHFWDKWLMNNPEKIPQIMKAKHLITSMGYKKKFMLSDQRYTNMYETIVNNSSAKTNTRDYISGSKGWLNIAAVICVFIGISTYYITSITSSESTQVTTENNILLSRETAAGQKLSITLPDGTKVKLNSLSCFQFPKKFDEHERVVYLEGEAFFEVAKDKKRPFLIKSNGFTAEVLGTSFNMVSNKEKKEVALVEGKLKIIERLGASIILKPEEKAILKERGGIEVRQFDPITTLGWKNGYLVFNKDDLFAIIDKIEAWYGVEVEIIKGLKMEGTYSGTFKNESLENVLIGIAATSNIKFKIVSKKIFLTPK